MNARSIGFIGGGRVVRILMDGLTRAGASLARCVVSDADDDALAKLKLQFPQIRATGSEITEPARQEIVFGALHPPAMKEVLPRIGSELRPDAVFVSLAPVIRIPALQQALGGFERVARMIPNAASIVGSGFNPIAFSTAIGSRSRTELLGWLAALGDCPEVPDGDLEAYAILTAMGPTYFWHQFAELERLGVEFGLDRATIRHALARMLHGGVDTFFDSHLEADEVIDLVPVKPLADSEAGLRESYRTRLRALHDKLTQRPAAARS